jgi:hypothetical protein
MTDWNSLVAAHGLDIPADELPRVTAPLDALEAAFRPLAAHLPVELEPAVTFECREEPGQ